MCWIWRLLVRQVGCGEVHIVTIVRGVERITVMFEYRITVFDGDRRC